MRGAAGGGAAWRRADRGGRHGPRDASRFGGQSIKKAELLLVAANCALAAGQPQTALDRAQAAYRMYRSQRNSWWLARTRLVLVQAKYAVGSVSPQLLREADRAAVAAGGARLRRGAAGASAGRAGGAWNGAAAVAADPSSHRGRFEAAARSGDVPCQRLAQRSVCGPRPTAQPRRLLAACRRGLEVLDEHRFTLGASELRAQATAHGAELAVLAPSAAPARGAPASALAGLE